MQYGHRGPQATRTSKRCDTTAAKPHVKQKKPSKKKVSPIFGTRKYANINQSRGTYYLYRAPRIYIKGWPNFCSGAILTQVSAIQRSVHVPEAQSDRLINEVKSVQTLAQYWGLVDDITSARAEGVYLLPMKYAHAAILERVLHKAIDGVGGEHMWGHNRYPTKTFVLADRDRRQTPYLVSNTSFAKFLRANKLANSHRLADVPGAHGGQCTTWLFSLNERACESYIDKRIEEVNTHVQYWQDRIGYGEPAHIKDDNQYLRAAWYE